MKIEVRHYDDHGEYDDVEYIELGSIKELSSLGYGSPIKIYEDEYITEYAFDLLPRYGFNIFKGEQS